MRLFFTAVFLCIAIQASPHKTVTVGHQRFMFPQNRNYGSPSPSNHAITSAQWRQLTTDKAFGYKNDREAPPNSQPYKPNAIQKFLSVFFNFFSTAAGKILLWGVVIIVVGYVVFRLVLNRDSFLFTRAGKTINEVGGRQHVEEDIATTNWEALLQQATADNDLRLAVRYSYMWLLQMLQKRELIKYRNDKTNYEYYTELNETSYKQPFRQLSRQYEYTWYGRFSLSASGYNEYKTLFDNIKRQLGA